MLLYLKIQKQGLNMDLTKFIINCTAKIAPLEKANHIAWWNLAVTGDDKFAKEYQDSKIELRKIFSSKEDYEFIKTHSKEKDPLIQRQATLLLHEYTENQIPIETIQKIVQLETEIESIYTNFRPVINGKEVSNNDVKKVLVECKDQQERKEAWEASKRIGEQVESKVKQLITMRNESAKKVGFTDFYSMRLKLQELDQERLFALLKQLEQETSSSWQKYKPQLDQTLAKRYNISTSEIKPWHYEDPFFQEAPRQKLDMDTFFKGKPLVDIGKKYYSTIGLPVDDILDRSDLYEREKKNQHAFCICIDRSQDVRTLCNMRDNAYWMSTLLHELGHAVYDKFIDQQLPFLLRTPAHTSTTEAIAMLFGRINYDGNFLHHYCDVDLDTAHKTEQLAKQQTAASLLVFARWVLVMTHFERAMYQQPGLDLNKFWWDCVERFQGIKRIPGRNQPDWAAKLHLACAPVYYQNYIIGEMTASQLYHKLQGVVKSHQEQYVTSPNVGKWLKTRLLSQGAKFNWEETLKHASGEALNPLYFALDTKIT